jgi:hypothetical protein
MGNRAKSLCILFSSVQYNKFDSTFLPHFCILYFVFRSYGLHSNSKFPVFATEALRSEKSTETSNIQLKLWEKSTKHLSRFQQPRSFIFGVIYKFYTKLRIFHRNRVGCPNPSWDDPKFERGPPGAPWPTFHKSNDAKLFLISILKALESLETFISGLVGLSLITRKTGASGWF